MRDGVIFRLCAALAAVLLLAAASGCGEVPGAGEKHTREVFAMDTLMELTAYGGDEARRALSDAVDKINELEDALSATVSGSDVYRINEGAGGAVAVSDMTLSQIAVAQTVAENTAKIRGGAALDISVYPVVKAWGFVDKVYRVPDDGEIAALLGGVDYSRVECGDGTVKLPRGCQIDLGSVAKGYTSGVLMSVFEDAGVSSAIVSLGGNVQALGTKPDGSEWNVAIQDPLDPDAVIGSVAIADGAVVTSGGYQRYFERDGVVYHHIFDPSTGRPADSGLLSVSAVCADGTLADALSTALFVLGLDGALEYWRTVGGFEAVIVTGDGRVVVTSGIRDSFSPAKGNQYEVVVVSAR